MLGIVLILTTLRLAEASTRIFCGLYGLVGLAVVGSLVAGSVASDERAMLAGFALLLAADA